MVNVQRKSHVVWEGSLTEGGANISESSSGSMQNFPVTFASRFGESGGKTSPEELLAASHASCYAMALTFVLGQSGYTPDRLEVDANCTIDDQQLEITTMELNVNGQVPGMDQSSFEQTAREAEQACPVSNAIRGGVDIKLSARLS